MPRNITRARRFADRVEVTVEDRDTPTGPSRVTTVVLPPPAEGQTDAAYLAEHAAYIRDRVAEVAAPAVPGPTHPAPRINAAEGREV